MVMAGYDPKEDPEAVAAHELYLKVVEHLPECAPCKRLEFAQIGKSLAVAVGPRGKSPEEAFKLLCPEGRRIAVEYWNAMRVWLASMRARGVNAFTVDV